MGGVFSRFGLFGLLKVGAVFGDVHLFDAHHVPADGGGDVRGVALAEAVREAGEAGRVTTGLVDTSADPIEYSASHDFNDPATSNHPVHRTKRIEAHLAAHKAQRRAHLRVVPDPSENADKDSGTE